MYLHFVADTCINVEGDNMTMFDNSLDSCVKVPVNTETDGISKLFSLNVGRECAINKSDVTIFLHFGNTTSEPTCNDKIGILASNGTECAGWKVCKVIFQKGPIPTKKLPKLMFVTLQFITRFHIFSYLLNKNTEKF